MACVGVCWPSTSVITSPACIPAAAAGPPGVILTTATPAGSPAVVTDVCAVTPSAARPDWVTLPVLMSCPAIMVTVSDGMAKPMPWALPASGSRAAAVGMPMTWSSRLTSAPPLLPPLIGALVCSALAIVVVGRRPRRPSVTVRPVAEMMPWVTLPVRPSGLPMARTICPALMPLEVPKVAACSDPAPDSTRITARSSGANVPSTRASSAVLPVAGSTSTVLAAPTTCALVTMSPLSS